MMRQLKVQSSFTARDSESIRVYLAELSRIHDNHENEVELARMIREGGEEGLRARNKLVSSNLRFVVSVAKQYQHQGMDLPDLINEGNIGLLKAADRYDESRSFKFISYAVWWVRQSIMQAIAESGRMIRLPLNQFSAHNLVMRERKAFMQLEGREPSIDDLVQMTGLKEEQVRLALSSHRHLKSLDAPIGEEDDGCLMDTVVGSLPSPDQNVENDGLTDIMKNYLKQMLKERDAEVICRFYGIGRQPLEISEIATDMGLTRERVRQIKERGLQQLKKDCPKYLRQFIA